jgi:hypothetical protein
MFIRIITSLIIFFVVFMGFKQGIAMISGKPESKAVFERANLNPFWQMLFGAFTLAGSAFILHPQLYKSGNIIMAVSILIIICLQISFKEIKSALIEVPFLSLNLLLIYLQYPLAK